MAYRDLADQIGGVGRDAAAVIGIHILGEDTGILDESDGWYWLY